MSMTTMVLGYVLCFGVLGTFAHGIISAVKSDRDNPRETYFRVPDSVID
jgi:hypothetical protein